jgi:nucleoside-diphosphate-sugar epimerase
VLDRCLDAGRAAIHLSWKPWTDLEEGLRRTLEWFRAVPVGARR